MLEGEKCLGASSKEKTESALLVGIGLKVSLFRAIARSENPEGLVVLWWA